MGGGVLDTVMEGKLTKPSTVMGGHTPRTVERYYVLNEAGRLTYTRKEGEYDKGGFLQAFVSVEATPPPRAGFVIKCAGEQRTHTFYAPSVENQQQWIAALQQFVTQKSSSSPPKMEGSSDDLDDLFAPVSAPVTKPRKKNNPGPAPPALTNQQKADALIAQFNAQVTLETKVFGVSVEDAVRAAADPTTQLPRPLIQSIEFLDKYGIDEEGIYRVPGSKNKVDTYKAMFNAGHAVKFESWEEAGNVTSLLVTWFREIPGSVFTGEGNARLHSLRNMTDADKIAAVKDVVGSLPVSNRRCVAAFMGHLRRVADNHKVNKMTAKNLSICIVPTLAGPILTMINHYEQVFGESASGGAVGGGAAAAGQGGDTLERLGLWSQDMLMTKVQDESRLSRDTAEGFLAQYELEFGAVQWPLPANEGEEVVRRLQKKASMDEKDSLMSPAIGMGQ